MTFALVAARRGRLRGLLSSGGLITPGARARACSSTSDLSNADLALLPYKGNSFYCRMRLPVRWGDMDAMGHVNNIIYLQVRAYFLEKSRQRKAARHRC